MQRTLKELILAIDNRNKIEAMQWKDWKSLDRIIDFYGNVKAEDGDKVSREYAEEVLQRAIDTNGESVKKDAAEYERKLHGNDQKDSHWISSLADHTGHKDV